MELNISNKNLLILYKTGSSKKYRLHKSVIDKFFMVTQKIEAAEDIYDFYKDVSLNFEKLKGCKSRYSMRLNLSYRLEMEIEWINNQMTIGIVDLVEISNHYQ